jgi:hypothetical protein
VCFCSARSHLMVPNCAYQSMLCHRSGDCIQSKCVQMHKLRRKLGKPMALQHQINLEQTIMYRCGWITHIQLNFVCLKQSWCCRFMPWKGSIFLFFGSHKSRLREVSKGCPADPDFWRWKKLGSAADDSTSCC